MVTTVFLLGATGYLGGAILAELVKHFGDNVEITALVRKQVHVDAVRKLGVRVEVVEGEGKGEGKGEDESGETKLIACITKHARMADITINAAGSDNIDMTNAILAGQKARVVEDKKDPAALLHTSGVAVFASGELGKHDANITQYNDGKEADIRAITAGMLHGQVDVLILRASEEGYTVSYIMCPGAVVGTSSGPVTTASLFFRLITKLALDYKKAVYVGEGSNVFYAVCLEDLIDLYRRVFTCILTREFANESPYTRYYLGTSTPLVWKDIATCLGQTLHELGKIENAKPESITVAEISDPTGVTKVYLGATQDVRAERGKGLGWEPRPVILNQCMKEGVEAALRGL